jgi:hypothetical protein
MLKRNVDKADFRPCTTIIGFGPIGWRRHKSLQGNEKLWIPSQRRNLGNSFGGVSGGVKRNES